MVLSISLDEDVNAVKEMAKAKSLDWHQGVVGDIQNQNAAKTLGISSVPMYILLDPTGKILVRSYNLAEVSEQLLTLKK